ncbi:hypothetical protein CAPTEDRAFT_209273 [Capitella teleta]|uniref:Exostosin GT47 domain-containing protein n=1 Tax=Capitella teleta TaxID=283909 RepID=R7U723_CAPTE|nr:hypothetical protein CAPTEDRAFT_209273 [Capitella teleta]|eukprot:ELU02170.1 hypothetical protein CAPTEDRAFT_209273 [Capitella teleta]
MRTIRLRLDGLLFMVIILLLILAFLYQRLHPNTLKSDRGAASTRNAVPDPWLHFSDELDMQTTEESARVACAENTLPLPDNVYILQPGTDVIGADMGSIRSKDTSLMKKVCDLVPECKGFNTNGWLKKSVDKTMEAPSTDLYVKQVLFTPKPLPQYDDNSEAIAHKDNFGAPYLEMMSSLKIFMYTSELDDKVNRGVHWKYGVESLFIKLLSKSSFVTKDAEEAHFFFLPFQCATYRNVIRDRAAAQNFTENLVSNILKDISSRYTYWDRSLGADHFYVCAHDMGASSVAAADANLQKNAIALVNTADYADPFYVPHKDIALPPHPAHGKGSLPDIGRGGGKSTERPNLAFYAGNLDSGQLRPVFKDWLNDSDIHIHHGHMSDNVYIKNLQSAKFCLVPRGHRVWSPVVMDAVWTGCVPVIISDYYDLPLHGLIDWTHFAVFLKEKEVLSLKSKLKSIPEEKLRRMQSYIKKV